MMERQKIKSEISTADPVPILNEINKKIVFPIEEFLAAKTQLNKS